MTTLIPPSAEQCAMIDEAARQHKTGEMQANYWNWTKTYENGFSVPLSCAPAPAHPQYDTYCKWKALVDAGQVAKGWWKVRVFLAEKELWFTAKPEWDIKHIFKVEKTYKHPGNCKPALKLIDWAKMPLGCETSEGTLLWSNGFSALVCRGVEHKAHAFMLNAEYLSLAIQTKFTHLQGGEAPPVIDGMVIEYEYMTEFRCRKVTQARAVLDGDCIGFRIIGLADGWTDEPELAK